MRHVCLTAALALAGLLLLAACKTARQGPETLPRPASGYLHWLQKDSMLTQSNGLIGQVSQSGRVWLQSSEPARADVLLNAAPNWYYAVPVSGPGFFQRLAAFADTLPRLGFYGLYLGDLGEKPNLLTSAGNANLPSASLMFDSAHGSEAEYEALAQKAETAGLQTGSQLLGAATGQGADFVLQTRNAPGYGGLYAMVPVDITSALPLSKDEWDCQALADSFLKNLDTIIPARLARDALPWASAGGWAATGAVAGVDGQPRRWLYRYSLDPARPVLAWQDPSGLAARLFSAAIIRLTGLLGQSLTGLSLEPLLGLEPENGAKITLSPGIDALNDMARQIHRYGGWALQADAVPASVIQAVLSGACDFCRDDLTAILVAFGLTAADGRPIAALYRNWINAGLPVARLARGLNGTDLLLRLLLDNPEWNGAHERLTAGASDFNALAAALAASPAERDNLKKFELVWRTGMPGLVFMKEEAPEGPEADSWLVNTLHARKKYNLAAGKVISVTRGRGGGLGLLTALPGGGYWLLACNFGIHADQLVISLANPVESALDAATGETLENGLNAKVFTMQLDGRIARNVLLK